MAITDNGFTAEEFSAAIAANADLLPIIKGTLTTNHKFIVQDEAEHQTYLKGKQDEVATNLTKTHAEKLEADVLAATGIPKVDANEKYYDYFKRATGKIANDYNLQKTELDALKAGAKPDDIQKARIKELEDLLSGEKTSFTETLSKKDKEILEIKLKSSFASDLASIRTKYKAGLPESMTKVFEQTVVADLMKKATIQEDGTVTFAKEDGTPELDPKTYKPVTISDKLTESLKEILDEKKVQTGTGTKKEDVITDPKDIVKNFTGLPAEVDTQVKLTRHLSTLGILQGSDEFDEIFEKFGKDLKLR